MYMLRTFQLTIKHNAMKCKIQNTGKTPVKNKYGKNPSNDAVYRALFLQILCPIFTDFVPYFYRFYRVLVKKHQETVTQMLIF